MTKVTTSLALQFPLKSGQRRDHAIWTRGKTNMRLEYIRNKNENCVISLQLPRIHKYTPAMKLVSKTRFEPTRPPSPEGAPPPPVALRGTAAVSVIKSPTNDKIYRRRSSHDWPRVKYRGFWYVMYKDTCIYTYASI